MAYPTNIGVIDTMVGFPARDPKTFYEFFKSGLRDRESQEWSFPASYMFKDVPEGLDPEVDPVAATLGEMDRFGVEKAVISVHDEDGQRAMKTHPDRFIPNFFGADGNEGMAAVRKIVEAYETYGITSVGLFPAGCIPQIPIDDKRWYPVYAKCAELELPVFITTGVPGPRFPMACQKVELVDEICWYFPELKVIMRHGGEPWDELAVKLLLKWPNLYYSTSAFTPKHYPQSIIDYANTRGADKIMFAGYWPWGLTMERVFRDLPNVPFADHVWPKFLRENALRLLGPR